MKKLLLLFVVVSAFIGIKAVAEIGMNPPAIPTGLDEEYYMCMWSPQDNDCIDGKDNYCICITEQEPPVE
jgi:hypothetical protein